MGKYAEDAAEELGWGRGLGGDLSEEGGCCCKRACAGREGGCNPTASHALPSLSSSQGCGEKGTFAWG